MRENEAIAARANETDAFYGLLIKQRRSGVIRSAEQQPLFIYTYIYICMNVFVQEFLGISVDLNKCHPKRMKVYA
jgi:hypothetical protein